MMSLDLYARQPSLYYYFWWKKLELNDTNKYNNKLFGLLSTFDASLNNKNWLTRQLRLICHVPSSHPLPRVCQLDEIKDLKVWRRFSWVMLIFTIGCGIMKAFMLLCPVFSSVIKIVQITFKKSDFSKIICLIFRSPNTSPKIVIMDK